MQSLTERRISPARPDALLPSSAGIGCRVEAGLTDGWFNTAYRVPLDDDGPAVVKLAQPTDVEVLRYERGILTTEAMVHRPIAALPGGGVPTPELVYAGEEFDLSLSVLLVTECAPRSFGSAHLAFCRGRLTDSVARLRALGQAAGRGVPVA